MSDSGERRVGHDKTPIPPWVEPEQRAPRPPQARTAPREVPAPWVDFERCGWRHFPHMTGGRWVVTASTCTSCGSSLRSLPAPD